ncbi:hypothetical protein OIU78_012051 [Salix suchowensis]|nr:hypothetical protein OIU78_012051 [Salix suchowensis]
MVDSFLALFSCDVQLTSSVASKNTLSTSRHDRKPVPTGTVLNSPLTGLKDGLAEGLGASRNGEPSMEETDILFYSFAYFRSLLPLLVSRNVGE